MQKVKFHLRGSLNLLIYSRLSFTSFKVLFKVHAYLVSAISLSPLKIFMLNGGLSLRTVVSIGLSGYIKEWFLSSFILLKINGNYSINKKEKKNNCSPTYASTAFCASILLDSNKSQVFGLSWTNRILFDNFLGIGPLIIASLWRKLSHLDMIFTGTWGSEVPAWKYLVQA